jgi:hypothetical protein
MKVFLRYQARKYWQTIFNVKMVKMQLLNADSNQSSKIELGAFFAIALGAFGLASCIDESILHRFLGSTSPLLTFALVELLGIALMGFLLYRSEFGIFRPMKWQGLWRYLILALLFGFNAILIDLHIVFPADINVAFPASLLFYPAINFFAQIVFHLLPLVMLFSILTWTFKAGIQEKQIWILISLVALLEPLYQMLYMNAVGTYSLWAIGIVGLHVYLINFFELWLFKRYDFIAMYLFRLVFYGVWHISWGHARLLLLF